MKLNILRLPVLILVFLGICVSAQDISNERSADDQEFRAQAVKYLRDTASEINTLRTNENRISFSSELANLMWLHDEKEARRMFSSVADNFIQLLAGYNSRVEMLGGMRDEDERYPGFGSGGDPRREAVRKLYKAQEVRSQVALAIAEHDAQFAYDFVIRTASVVTDTKLAADFAEQNARLEKQIIERMAVRDVENSLAFGRRSLKRGFSTELVGLVVKVYGKDPKAAIEFGKELVDKVRAEASPKDESFAHLSSILEIGGEMLDKNEDGKEPLFQRKTLESLAELLAGNLLQADEVEPYSLDGYIGQIEKYSPSQAGRVRAKFADDEEEDKSDDVLISLPDPSPERPSAEQAAEQARAEERLALMKELREFSDNELSKEQKAQFIGKARRIVGEMDDPMMKMLALSTLATRVKRLGDSELASEIMREANVLVKPNPQNFLDYALVWLLASGYSEVEPDEAFSIIEDAIYRLNDTIGAMVKVAEFIDVQGEIIIDGEVQLGSFGGSMTRSVVGMAENSGSVLRSLSIADFERTKALAGKFEKPEVRILARFLILRSVLDNDETKAIGLIN